MPTKWVMLILFLAGLLAYGNTAKNGLFWDDDEFITKNAYIRSFRYLPQWFSQPLTAGAGVNSNYYRPLLTANFAIDYHLWRLWPAGYHLENLLWHVAAATLLYLFLIELLPQIFNFQFFWQSQILLCRTIFNSAKMVAFATSLLWLVHPIHVEAVAYANSRGDSMATVFILLSLILWMKNKIKGSAIAFILALLSKEFAIVTPGLILLIESLRGASATWQSILNRFQRPDQIGTRNDGKTKPFLIILSIAIVYILLRLTTLNFQNTLNFYGTNPIRSNLCAAERLDLCSPFELYATSAKTRLLTFFKVLPIYGSILIWPNDLHMERTVDIPKSLSDSTVLSTIGLLVLIGLLVYWLFVIHKQSLPLFAAGWFFISILPVSGLIPISQILAEHFLYLPSIGFFLLFIWLLFLIISLLPISPRFRLIVFYSLITPISLILLNKTILQNRVWRDPITFYEYTLAHAQPTARVYNNLAMAYADTKNHDKAIENYQKSIALGDIYPNPHYNLGNTYVEIGETKKAEEEYKKALKIDPNFHYATLKLGQVYIDRGKIDDAKNLVCPVFPTQPLCL